MSVPNERLPEASTQPPVVPDPTSSAAFSTAHLIPDLKGRSVRGGAVTVGSQVTMFVLNTAATVVMARLLTPADFGLIAMVTAVTGFVYMFNDLGLGMVTIQKKEITHQQVSTLFWANVGIGVVLTVLTCIMAPFVAWFYGEPRLFWITLALACSFIFGGLTIQHYALLRRQMRFVTLGVNQAVSMALGVLAGILSSLLGAGYWAIVIMTLVRLGAQTVGAWLALDWRPGWITPGVGSRSMLAFGGYFTGFNVVNYFARSLDHVLIGRVWGALPLGLYFRAYSLLMLPLLQINVPLGQVTIPGLSHLQEDPKRFAGYYLKSLALINFLALPITLISIIFAPKIILVFLGSQWMEASGIFRYLALGAPAEPTMFTIAWLFIARGRSDLLFKYGCISTAIMVAAFLVGLPYGPRGVALAYSCSVLIWTPLGLYLATRNTSITTRGILGSVGPVGLGAMLGGIASTLFLVFLGRSWPALPALTLGSLIFVVVYLFTILVLLRQMDFYLSVWRSLRKS